MNKEFLKGALTGVFIFLSTSDIIRILADNLKNNSILVKMERTLFYPGIGMWKPLTKRCSKELRGKFIMRDYFGCNYIQNKINDLIYDI